MHTVPTLDYEYDALAPVISREIMELHHDKHHRTYVDKLNAALEPYEEWREQPVEELLRRIDELPEEIRLTVRNNAGGHYNHSLFWKVLSPNGGGRPSGRLADDLIAKYGTVEAFIEQFDEQALALFGSGWVWLTADLDIVSSPNQDSPLMHQGTEPIMGLDVWEHAYYLDYRNKRDEYVQAWWGVVDWGFVASRYR